MEVVSSALRWMAATGMLVDVTEKRILTDLTELLTEPTNCAGESC